LSGQDPSRALRMTIEALGRCRIWQLRMFDDRAELKLKLHRYSALGARARGAVLPRTPGGAEAPPLLRARRWRMGPCCVCDAAAGLKPRKYWSLCGGLKPR
jgi:hypothetical protein